MLLKILTLNFVVYASVFSMHNNIQLKREQRTIVIIQTMSTLIASASFYQPKTSPTFLQKLEQDNFQTNLNKQNHQNDLKPVELNGREKIQNLHRRQRRLNQPQQRGHR